MSADRPDSTQCAYEPDLWFSEKSDDVRYVKSVCFELCPVQGECLLLALEYEGASPSRSRFGVWGGYTAKERQAMAPRSRVSSGDPPEDVAA